MEHNNYEQMSVSSLKIYQEREVYVGTLGLIKLS